MSPEWFEWLRKNMPPKMFEEFEAERIHSAKWRDDEISRLQSALATEKKRREEAEAALVSLQSGVKHIEARSERAEGLLREEQKRRKEAEEEIVRSRYATRRAAEEGVALQARVQELETDLEGQRLRADLAATMMAEDREAGKRWLDALRDDNARLREALDDLQKAEAAYRMAHDAHGDGHLIAGRCWDLMRQSGDKARAALAKPEWGAS